MIDPSGFQQYGPELRSVVMAQNQRVDHQAGYSGLLVIHMLGVRGLNVKPSQETEVAPNHHSNTGMPIEHHHQHKNLPHLYCVIECDRVYKARTVAVEPHESNSLNFDWDEIFDIDLFDTKEVTLLFYNWNNTTRHNQCSKGTIHLPWISTLRTQHVHAFEMRLYETPGAMLYLKLEYHDIQSSFKRIKRSEEILPLTNSARNRSSSDSLQPLFGIELDTVMARENSGFTVPIILKRCTEEVERRGLHLPGIYRLCGSAVRKKILREQFEKNVWLAGLSEEEIPDINVITSKDK